MKMKIAIFGILLISSTAFAKNENWILKHDAAQIQDAISIADLAIQQKDGLVAECYKLGGVNSTVNDFIDDQAPIGKLGRFILNTKEDLSGYCTGITSRSKALKDLKSLRKTLDKAYPLSDIDYDFMG